MTKIKRNNTVAIIGRPNVGKSALFNRIVGKRISIVHEEVGVTRDRISAEAVHNDYHFEIIDTGGLSHFNKEISREISKEILIQNLETFMRLFYIILIVF